MIEGIALGIGSGKLWVFQCSAMDEADLKDG
jgi:hypothetical protein